MDGCSCEYISFLCTVCTVLVLKQSTEIGKHSLGGVSAPGLVKLRNNDVLGLAIYLHIT